MKKLFVQVWSKGFKIILPRCSLYCQQRHVQMFACDGRGRSWTCRINKTLWYSLVIRNKKKQTLPTFSEHARATFEQSQTRVRWFPGGGLGYDLAEKVRSFKMYFVKSNIRAPHMQHGVLQTFCSLCSFSCSPAFRPWIVTLSKPRELCADFRYVQELYLHRENTVFISDKQEGIHICIFGLLILVFISKRSVDYLRSFGTNPPRSRFVCHESCVRFMFMYYLVSVSACPRSSKT